MTRPLRARESSPPASRPRIVRLALVFALLASAPSGAFASGEEMHPRLRAQARRAVDAGLHYLRGTQADDGSWSNSVGVTAIALRAFLESHRGYSEKDGAFITRPLEFILAHVNDDGSISEANQNRNYSTAVALVALQATGNEKYRPIIANAQKFLAGLQIDEKEGYESDHAYYGGIGYGGDERPDLSNQYMAIEALQATAFDPSDPAWEKAKLFLSRCQNRSESNDQEWAGNDGGFTYMPGYSPHGDTGSYGGMTHAGLISLLFAGVDKNDPRVQSAYDWIRANYSLDTNPGAKDDSGLYYYYTVFAKSMTAYGGSTVTTTDGVEHAWRDEFARKILSLQNEDGSWVNTASPRWMEGNKDLTTARMVIALNLVTR
ncbi:MAG: prenyltransferase/squalene oxidase repeat-containing protein [Myxococcota bacterium]